MKVLTEVNQHFSLIELIKRYKDEENNFIRCSENIINALVFALYETRFNDDYDTFTVSNKDPESFQLSTDLYDYHLSSSYMLDTNLDDVQYESIYNMPSRLLYRYIIIVRKEPLPNDTPTQIEWYGAWTRGNNEIFDIPLDLDDMVYLKYAYLLAEVFEDLTHVYEKLQISQHRVCKQYETFYENKRSMMDSAYFLDNVANTVSLDTDIAVNYSIDYMAAYEKALGHTDMDTYRERIADLKSNPEKMVPNKDDGPIF